MSRRRKLVNHSGIPQHEIETIARILLPDILAYYESEEGPREFAEWKAHGMQLEMITRLRKSPEDTEKGRQQPSFLRVFSFRRVCILRQLPDTFPDRRSEPIRHTQAGRCR